MAASARIDRKVRFQLHPASRQSSGDYPAAARSSEGSRPITLLANPGMRPGDHTLTLALSEPGREGILIREYQTDSGEGQLDKLLTDEESIELLLVQEAKSPDTLPSFWTACSAGSWSRTATRKSRARSYPWK